MLIRNTVEQSSKIMTGTVMIQLYWLSSIQHLKRFFLFSARLSTQSCHLQHILAAISISHEAVDSHINHRENPSDEDENSHRNVIFHEDNHKYQMQMNAFAKHPKVIAEHQVLSQYVQNNAPSGIFADDIGGRNDELKPRYPKNAVQRYGAEKLSVYSNPRTSQWPEMAEIFLMWTVR